MISSINSTFRPWRLNLCIGVGVSAWTMMTSQENRPFQSIMRIGSVFSMLGWYCWWLKSGQPVEVGSLSHYIFKGFLTSQVVQDFFQILKHVVPQIHPLHPSSSTLPEEKWTLCRKNPGQKSSFGLSPLPVRVTTRIITFLVGNPYKPSFPLLLGGGTTQVIIIFDLDSVCVQILLGQKFNKSGAQNGI